MVKKSKIGVIRAELTRIASVRDREDIFSPTMLASWSYQRVVVIGHQQIEFFDYDDLLETLHRIPSGEGEQFFWNVMMRRNHASQIENAHTSRVSNVVPFRERRSPKIV